MFRQSLAVMGDLCTRSMRIEHLQTARAKHERRTPADCTQSDLIAYTPTYTLHLLATFADASAIGTTVLQIKEIPSRPSEFDGAICLFNVAQGIDERKVREQLKKFGDIVSYTTAAGCTTAVVLRAKEIS